MQAWQVSEGQGSDGRAATTPNPNQRAMRDYLPPRAKDFNTVFLETTTPAVCRAIRFVICLLDEAHLRL
jgi:hypothetical protein